MTRTIRKITTASAFSLVMLSAPVPAADLEWDIDGDGVLTENEFMDGFRQKGAFSSWDANGDGMLSEDEFHGGVFRVYDADGSGMIEEPELSDIGDDMGDGGFWDI